MKLFSKLLVGGLLIFAIYKFRNQISAGIIDLIKQFEGLRLNAYNDGGGVWTIGYGTTIYPDGSPVRPGDSITIEQANQYFLNDLTNFAQGVENRITSTVNSKQFSALVSFAYNVGLGAFGSSTLLQKVNNDPGDPSIRNEFMRWVYDNGQFVQGLENRRIQESNLYFS